MQCNFIAFTRALLISFMLGCFGGIEVCVQENEKHCMLMNMNMNSHFNKSSSSWVQGSSLSDTSDVNYDNYGGTYANQSPSLGMLSYGKLHTVHEEEEEVAISLRFLGDDGACDRSGLQPEVKKELKTQK